jgi:hypothetical protein
MDINIKVLSEVAYQLEKGNPWWGMALCNRYLPAHSPLRRAIAQRFTQRIGRTQANTKTAQILIQGSDSEAILHNPELLGSRVVRSRRPLPVPRHSRSQRPRLATRTRAHQTPRHALHLGARRSSALQTSNSRNNYLSAVRSR